MIDVVKIVATCAGVALFAGYAAFVAWISAAVIHDRIIARRLRRKANAEVASIFAAMHERIKQTSADDAVIADLEAVYAAPSAERPS